MAKTLLEQIEDLCDGTYANVEEYDDCFVIYAPDMGYDKRCIYFFTMDVDIEIEHKLGLEIPNNEMEFVKKHNLTFDYNREDMIIYEKPTFCILVEEDKCNKCGACK